MRDAPANSDPDRSAVKKWAKIRLWLGYFYLLIALIISRPQFSTSIIGLSLIILGIVIRLSTTGILKKDVELCTSGIYSLTRNPLYLGSGIIALGFAIMSLSLWMYAFLCVILAPAYYRMITLEEDYLSKLHVEQFAMYRRTVPKFLPGKIPIQEILVHFELKKVRGSREIGSSILILVLVLLILIIH